MTSCPTVHKSHPQISLYMGYSLQANQSDCIWNHITTTLTSLSQNTTCRDIYVGVTCGQLDMRSLLNMFHPYHCPHTCFTSESSLHFLKFLCLFVYFLMAFGQVISLPPPGSINTHSYIFAVLCVWHTPRSREESWKATV